MDAKHLKDIFNVFQIWFLHTWCSMERGNELFLLTLKWLHWLLHRVMEVCSQGWTVEHDQALSKSPVADCLELIRSPGSFGRHTAIGSIYLLKTTKVSGNTETGSQMVIFLLFTFFCVLGSRFVEVFETGTHIRDSLRDFRVIFLAVLWR